MKTIRFLICLACLANANAFGRTQDDAKQVAFQFRAITWGYSPINGLVLASSGDDLQISAPISQRSEAMRYRGPELLQFFPIGADPQTSRPVATVTANPNWQEMLLLLFPNQSKLGVIALDDSQKAFPENTIRVLNYTAQNITGYVGGSAVQLSSTDEVVIPIKQSGGFTPIRFAAQNPTNQKWERFLSSAIETTHGMRALVIFYPVEESNHQSEKSISFKLFCDFPNQDIVSSNSRNQ